MRTPYMPEGKSPGGEFRGNNAEGNGEGIMSHGFKGTAGKMGGLHLRRWEAS